MSPRRTFYKSTRADGTDFHTGTIHYVVGKTVRPKRSTERYICGPGYLHAADVPTETLIGGSWPCRLFAVEGKPHVGFDSQHPHKGGFRQLRVIEELPAHEVFGPQGREVVALIERAGRLTGDEAERLVTAAAWDAAWSWVAARDAARNAARAEARAAARSWVAARDAAWAAGDAARAAGDAAGAAARAAAGAVAWDAAIALVTRDLITPEHFDVLYGPWKEVVG